MCWSRRAGPLAMNNQSWYFTGSNDEINVYWARSAMNGRMNQINAGIALCHLWLAAAHEGGYGKIVRDPPRKGRHERAMNMLDSANEVMGPIAG